MKGWNIKTIVLGYDGSEGARRAAELASAMAHKNNARLVVVTAFHEPDVAGKGEMADRVNPDISPAQSTANSIVAELKADGIDAEADVIEGHASEALLRVADAHRADLIVIGRRGHGLISELLLGSTSEYVIRRAKIPVLVAH